jgi:hypothetical protein
MLVFKFPHEVSEVYGVYLKKNFFFLVQNDYSVRRMSDPSSSSGARFPGGFRRTVSMKKSRSDAEKMDSAVDKEDEDEVLAGTFQDGMSVRSCFWCVLVSVGLYACSSLFL